jgi:hypothetical protein
MRMKEKKGMKGEKEERPEEAAGLPWKRWGEYALGMAIETSAVGAISLLALLVMYVIKAIVK